MQSAKRYRGRRERCPSTFHLVCGHPADRLKTSKLTTTRMSLTSIVGLRSSPPSVALALSA